MRKLFTFSFLLFFLTGLTAQITKQEDASLRIDSLLKPLNKAGFTTNILYERVVSFANLNNFHTTNNNTSNKEHFEQALSELFRASNKTKFTAPKTIRKHYAKENDIVDIGLINAQYNSLNYNKENENLGGVKLINKKLIPITGKTLFSTKNVLVIAPLKMYAKGNRITFQTSKEFFFTESPKKIQQVVATIENKTFIIVSNGNTFLKHTQTFTSSGEKTIQFTATYKDGSIITTFGKLYITANALNRTFEDPLIEDGSRVEADIPFKGYESSDSPIKGQLDYRTYYHTNNNNQEKKLLQPILILDAFDPQDKRKISDSDSPLPAGDHESIEELMIYYQGINKKDIIKELREEGYDVVIVNFPVYPAANGQEIDGGADYIERNAFTLVKLIQNINSTLATNRSNNKLVIVGPSMGGQISRYALAYMEKQQELYPNEPKMES